MALSVILNIYDISVYFRTQPYTYARKSIFSTPLTLIAHTTYATSQKSKTLGAKLYMDGPLACPFAC